ncbi:MAG: hypothetical protein PHU46_03910 [Rhodocyclaceae bacterium]|nr:hypothetical protein [Rhodocyclaceae bacterium]
MKNISQTFQRVLNALAFDNVGNLGELRRKLRETDAEPRPQLRPVLHVVSSRATSPVAPAMARRAVAL